MTTTTILCDLDGTLVDSRRDIALAFQHAWRTVIGEIPPSAAAVARHIGKPLANMVSDLGGMLSPPLLDDFLTAYRHTYTSQEARLTRTLPWGYPHLTGLVQFHARRRHHQRVRASGDRFAAARAHPLLPAHSGRCPGLRLKPAPDTILAALSALHCAPAHALMVGDTPADVLAGKAAGTKTCAVTYGFGTREALLQCAPDHVIESFRELVDLVRESRG